MQRLFFIIGFTALLFETITGCSKTATTVLTVSSESEQQWLVNSTWQFTGTANILRPVLFDSIHFSFINRESDTHWRDSITAYYVGSRLIITTLADFYVRSMLTYPDTLFTPFSPYTVSGAQIDTFLLYNNNGKLGILQRLTSANIGLQQDSMVHK